jgi:uncharacterized small protein (DUF1192 family)
MSDTARIEQVEAELRRLKAERERDSTGKAAQMAPPAPPKPSQLAVAIGEKQEAQRRLRQDAHREYEARFEEQLRKTAEQRGKLEDRIGELDDRIAGLRAQCDQAVAEVQHKRLKLQLDLDELSKPPPLPPQLEPQSLDASRRPV